MRRLEFASLQVKNLELSKEFYTQKLGFRLSGLKNPEAYVFQFNKNEASFAIRKPLTQLDNKPLGLGVSLWFAINEDIELLRLKFLDNNVPLIGDIMHTPFGKALHIIDPDGYKLTFLEPANHDE